MCSRHGPGQRRLRKGRPYHVTAPSPGRRASARGLGTAAAARGSPGLGQPRRRRRLAFLRSAALPRKRPTSPRAQWQRRPGPAGPLPHGLLRPTPRHFTAPRPINPLSRATATAAATAASASASAAPRRILRSPTNAEDALLQAARAGRGPARRRGTRRLHLHVRFGGAELVRCHPHREVRQYHGLLHRGRWRQHLLQGDGDDGVNPHRQHVHGSDEGHHHERQRQASSGNAGREDRGFLLLPRCAIIQGKRPRLPLTAFSPPCFRVAPALPRADLTGAIVGGIIGGLAFIALVAMWRFSVTKTGPFAEGMTFMTWVTCKGPHSVVVGAK